MNKTFIYGAIAAMVLLGLSGAILLILFDKDVTAFITFFGTTLAVAISATVTINALSEIKKDQSDMKEQQNAVAKSVNGNTTKLLEMASKSVDTEEEALELERIARDNQVLKSTLTGPIPTTRREYMERLDNA